MSDHYDLNEEWCRWLNRLNQYDRRRVLNDELFYFDAVKSGNMTVTEVLRHANGAESLVSV